jgi:type IV secretory pathway TraG/TraD family ATPase VirD4
MYQIRVKNESNSSRYIKDLDTRTYTKEEADKVFLYTINQFQGLNAIVCLYDFKSNDLLQEQHCQFLG